MKTIEGAGSDPIFLSLTERQRERTWSLLQFFQITYDVEHDRSICPNGQPLSLTKMEYKAEKAEYQLGAATCNACPLKAECTPSSSGRQVHRPFHADYLERVKGYYQTETYQKALRKRKV